MPLNDPVKPERSNYYDVGVDQTVLPGLDVGVDAYYKDARDMLDDGQFGQAVVLTQFNYARGYSEGGEFKLKYPQRRLQGLRELSLQHHQGHRRGVEPVSDRRRDYNYLLTHWHYTDDMQLMTGSAGASYRWNDNLFTADMIYGSGLRSGFANRRSATRPMRW